MALSAAGDTLAYSPGLPRASQIGFFRATAVSTNRVMVVCPMPRAGVLMIRNSETSSCGWDQQFHVRQDVADFLPIVKRLAPDQNVRHFGSPQLLLEQPRLLVRAEKDGKVAVVVAPGGDGVLYLANDQFGLDRLVLGLQDTRLLAANGRAKLLVVANRVERNQPVGPVNNLPRAAVVGFQSEQPWPRANRF